MGRADYAQLLLAVESLRLIAVRFLFQSIAQICWRLAKVMSAIIVQRFWRLTLVLSLLILDVIWTMFYATSALSTIFTFCYVMLLYFLTFIIDAAAFKFWKWLCGGNTDLRQPAELSDISIWSTVAVRSSPRVIGASINCRLMAIFFDSSNP